MIAILLRVPAPVLRRPGCMMDFLLLLLVYFNSDVFLDLSEEPELLLLRLNHVRQVFEGVREGHTLGLEAVPAHTVAHARQASGAHRGLSIVVGRSSGGSHVFGLVKLEERGRCVALCARGVGLSREGLGEGARVRANHVTDAATRGVGCSHKRPGGWRRRLTTCTRRSAGRFRARGGARGVWGRRGAASCRT